ncbi:MAG: porin, partial [Planctomycetaceae bacterium]
MLKDRLEPIENSPAQPEPAIDDSGLPAFLQQSAEENPVKSAAPEPKKEKKWFEKYTIRGYVQMRINDVLDSDGPGAPQTPGDSSIGDRQSFLLRRVRMIIQGDVSEHVSLYFQPDFAAAVPGSTDSNQYAQIRDMYADVHLDDQKELRFRIGQSKVPYGWENLQSSSNRLPL